ncbi:uncharacterized protein LOC125236154 [Leguminivora glycinivorella]|uniref:uncharacterized protein LOC125236154 n=1 Tax=Leguminivora glycinivorella TaxID=1035111 RepID=UPI00200EDBFD|nr:uncharacterized protein LOC125236154 [Leguminivora glycinivorella]
MERLRSSVEQNILLTWGHRQTASVQSPIQSDRLWQQPTNMLNSTGGGVQRPVEKWKKVWADMKTKTKSKALKIKKHLSNTGGGPHGRLRLSELEEWVLTVMGVACVTVGMHILLKGAYTTIWRIRGTRAAAWVVFGFKLLDVQCD